MEKKKLFVIILIIALFAGVILQNTSKDAAGAFVPVNRAGQQQAWTIFDVYDASIGGTKLTGGDGVANVTVTNLTNTTVFISPLDHRLVQGPEVYILKYFRFNSSNSSSVITVTLQRSLNGDNFTTITSQNITGGIYQWDMTLVAGKAPLVFTNGSILKLNMNVTGTEMWNTTLRMETFGSN